MRSFPVVSVIKASANSTRKSSRKSFSSYVKTKPSYFYRDPNVYHKEIQNLFMPSWQYFCSLSQLKDPGSYVSRVILNHPIFAISGKDGSVNVFHNVCSHRGSNILPEEKSDRVDVLRCGYHGWCFNHTGRLVSAPYYDKNELDCSKLSLKPVKFEVWRDLVFICVNGKPQKDLNYQLELLDKDHTSMDLENNYIFAKDFEYPANKFNWKLLMENNIENTHIPYVHPDTLIKHWDEYFDNVHVTDDKDREFAQMQLFKDNKALDGKWSFIWPNHIFSLYENYCLWERIYPLDIKKTKNFFSVFVNKNSKALEKFEGDLIKTADYLVSLSNKVNMEDFVSCSNQQRNMENEIYESGIIHNYWDKGTAIFEKYYMDNINHNI